MHMLPKQEILTVAQLSQAIKQHLEGRFAFINVQGEISNLKEQSGSGHFYFTLKDAEAQVSAVLFKGNARGLSRAPKNGDQVIVKGELSVYPPRGYYQIIVRELSFAGVGALLLQLHEMKLKLQARGWFDKGRRKPLPKYPKTIGVVTSASGSVIQDILHILTRRLSAFHLILNPVKVQGEGSAQEIAQAIAEFNKHQMADVLIVGRGGGSLEDLWAFNEEKVAEAIFHSKIPVVSAVGHETDYCIADFVADVRAPTPSAAAEIITTEKAHQLQFLSSAQNRLQNGLRVQLTHMRKQLEGLKRQPFFFSPYAILAPYIQRLDNLHEDIDTAATHFIEGKRLKHTSLSKQIAALSPKNQVVMAKQKIGSFERTLHNCLKAQLSTKRLLTDRCGWLKKIDLSLQKRIAEKKEKLLQLAAHLKGIDPKNLLAKGFCLLFEENEEHLIHSAHALTQQNQVCLRMHDGKARLNVNEVIIAKNTPKD
jgi:exodeoxyribonuclease VII large subunit